MRRRACFTLIELLVVIFIISMGAILTGVKIKDMYEEQRFYSEAQQVLSKLAMAQDLMLIMDADVQVKISPDAETGGLQVWLDAEKPFEEPWARFVERKLSLQSIGSYSFDENSGRDLTLRFSFGGMSKGVLKLFEGKNRSGKRKYSISLAGYPRPFKGTAEDLKRERVPSRYASDKGKVLYPAEVYKQLYEDPNQEKESF